IQALAGREYMRPHLVQEDEGTDHAPLPGWQGAPHFETVTQVMGTRHYHYFQVAVGQWLRHGYSSCGRDTRVAAIVSEIRAGGRLPGWLPCRCRRPRCALQPRQDLRIRSPCSNSAPAPCATTLPCSPAATQNGTEGRNRGTKKI